MNRAVVGRGGNPHLSYNRRYPRIRRSDRQRGQVSCASDRNRQLLTNNSFSEIVGYLERQYDDILAEESRIKRNPRFRDNRVHAMLYFITPTGHG